MQPRLSSTYIKALPAQLYAMNDFAQASSMQPLLHVWPKAESVLHLNGIQTSDVGQPPISDDMIRSFQRTVLDRVRPPLSDSIMMLFDEPAPDAVAMIKNFTLANVYDFRDNKVVDNDAGHILIASAELYFKLGKQIETAHEFFSLKGDPDDGLLWRMRMIFALNNQSTRFVRMVPLVTPANAYAHRAALKEMIRPRLEQRLGQLTPEETTWNEMAQNHGITKSGIEAAMENSIISRSIGERVLQKIKGGSLLSRLRSLFTHS